MSELDPRLVAELEEYSDTKEHLYKAIKYIKEDREYRKGLDEARLALELLCKEIFNTPNKSLENQENNISKRIYENGYSQRFINFICGYLRGYESYNNHQVKHDDGRSIRSKEANLMLKNISELIQLLIYQVVIAVGTHLFPFRTEKLSSLAPMVLQCLVGE